MTEVSGLSSESRRSLLHNIAMSLSETPSPDAKIFKDECTYCFNTPFSPGGLFICLKTFTCYCSKHIHSYAEKTQSVAFLQTLSRKVKQERKDEPEAKISRLAIGMEGGFSHEKEEVEDEYNLILFPNLEAPIPIADIENLPIKKLCELIATTTSAERLQLLQSASNAWDGESKIVTKHADLKQCDNPPMVPKEGWECGDPGCGLKENLWMNLTDGSIFCGRSNILQSGERSPGNDHSRKYYNKTSFPLVVKLGTITKGTADVFSYEKDEDDVVVDPNIEKHLAHFGINMHEMVKTVKSTVELDMDLNTKYMFSVISEEGEELEKIYGPGYTGIHNTGNSCYINSVIFRKNKNSKVVQALLLIPTLRERYGSNARRVFDQVEPQGMMDSFEGQTAKLFAALLSGDYSKEDSDNNGITPKQFKRVAAQGHAEFSTAKQQDAEEYIRYLLDKIQSEVTAEEEDPTLPLRFLYEEKTVKKSGKVRYNKKTELILALPVPEERLEPIHPQEGDRSPNLRFSVALKDCLNEFFKMHELNHANTVSSQLRMATFPEFLLMQIQRFRLSEKVNAFGVKEFVQQKMDVDVVGAEELDLEEWRAHGLQSGEVEVEGDDAEEEEEEAQLPAVRLEFVAALEAMGFSHNSSLRAVVETKNLSVEGAADWLMAHLDDPDIHLPYRLNKAAASTAMDSDVAELCSLGFTKHQARYALKQSREVNAAAEWLFSNAESVPEEKAEPDLEKLPNGPSKYKLVALISHMGSNTACGHYVAHIFKDGKWVFFNDEKVALSKKPPVRLAYLYLYQRIN